MADVLLRLDSSIYGNGYISLNHDQLELGLSYQHVIIILQSYWILYLKNSFMLLLHHFNICFNSNKEHLVSIMPFIFSQHHAQPALYPESFISTQNV